MSKKFLALAIASALMVGCQQKAEEAAAPAPLKLDTEETRVAYGIGRNIGMNMKQQNIELDMASFQAGMDDALKGAQSRVSDADIMAAMQSFQQKQMEKQKTEREAKATENKTASDAFLAANAKKEGVVTTASGLQYKIVTAGTGAQPKEDDVVEVHYRGTFVNGEEFDSSYKRGQTVTFPVKGVIAGWTEALLLMPTGSKWELYIPSDLAYGPGGTGRIGPNQALVFEVELVGIKPKEQAAEAAAK